MSSSGAIVGEPCALPIVEIGKLIGLVTVTDVLAAEVAEAMR